MSLFLYHAWESDLLTYTNSTNQQSEGRQAYTLVATWPNNWEVYVALFICSVFKKKTTAHVVWCFLRSLSQLSDTTGFLYDQGTEKAEESGEKEAQKEDKEDAGNLAESQENVSVCFSHRSFTGCSSVHQMFMELLPGARDPGRMSVSTQIRSWEASQEEATRFHPPHWWLWWRLVKGQKGSPRKDPEPRPGGTGPARLQQFAVVLLGFFITRGLVPCHE